MALLIDSGILIGLERQERPWREVLPYDPWGERLAIASITASELLAGVHRAESESRRARRLAYIEDIFDGIAVLAFDLEAARVHSRLWYDLAIQGLPIGPNDLIIASTALANGCAILTDNVREFARIPNLEVRRPGW